MCGNPIDEHWDGSSAYRSMDIKNAVVLRPSGSAEGSNARGGVSSTFMAVLTSPR